jgi:hypothetical protein
VGRLAFVPQEIEDRIQQLRAPVLATDGHQELNRLCVEFGDALNQHIGRLRDQVRAFRDSSSTPAFEKGDQGGMLDEQSKQKMKELCDLIAKEQDRQRFSSLMEELNRLLDDCYTAPATEKRETLKRKDPALPSS